MKSPAHLSPAKRMFDMAVAGCSLILLSPLLAALAVALLLLQGRPILFRQERVGRGGTAFMLLKFRTMTRLEGAEKGSFDVGGTARITPLGRSLRRTKLDELPQLWNVLRGDMALVGPRPEVRRWVEVYPERWARVLRARPGITDPASILYRDEETLLAQSPDPERTYRETVLPHKLSLYENYVNTRTFRGDLRILLNTLRAVVRPNGNARAQGKEVPR